MQPRPEDQKIAEQLVQRLVAEFQPKRIVWFGSRARGEGGPDSDWDVMVIADSALSQHRRMVDALRVTRDVHVPVDIVVFTPSERDRLADWKSSIVYSAETTGVVLYEAG